jgi:ribosomal protein L21E
MLSVIVLSMGDRRALEGALAAVAGRCRRMEAEVIVVRASGGEGVGSLTDLYPGVIFLEAPAECADRELREIGMGFAKGDIIALRMDGAIGDGAWLSAFHATVGTVDNERPLELEVGLAVAVEETATSADRRRNRAASLSAAPASSVQKRRSDAGRASAGFADVASLAPTLGSEM